MLEAHDVLTLKKAFAYADHEFIQEFVYLTEEAITNRIEEVDPAWQFDILNIVHEGSNAICHGRLTIKGTTRDGIGMQKIIEKAGEPAKGAATDALKRCARLFGIGRYLLDAPKKNEFAKWLADQQKATQQPRPTPAPLPPQPAAPTQGQADASPKQITVGDDLDKALDEGLGIVTGEVEVSEVEVKLDKKQKPYLTFRANNVTVTAFSRDPLRGVLDDATLDDLKMTGTHKLPTLKISYRQKEGFNNLVAAELKGAA